MSHPSNPDAELPTPVFIEIDVIGVGGAMCGTFYDVTQWEVSDTGRLTVVTTEPDPAGGQPVTVVHITPEFAYKQVVVRTRARLATDPGGTGQEKP